MIRTCQVKLEAGFGDLTIGANLVGFGLDDSGRHRHDAPAQTPCTAAEGTLATADKLDIPNAIGWEYCLGHHVETRGMRELAPTTVQEDLMLCLAAVGKDQATLAELVKRDRRQPLF